MSKVSDAIPALDLRHARPADLKRDVFAAAAVTFLAIPQGIAYAMIAGLPPAMGLYATCIPAIVGALFRSSRHVATGPTNAVSLLVGAAFASAADLDPVQTALLLALLVGVIQVCAGLLRLGALVDYISSPVVLGYITGAGILIGIGQLPNLTDSAGGTGHVIAKLHVWISDLAAMSPVTLAVGLGSAALVLVLRWIDRRIPAALIMLTLATFLSWALEFDAHGLQRIADRAPIPSGLPPLTVPSMDGWAALLPLAVAVTVLSLAESTSVARSISSRTGQRLRLSHEFIGQGLANISAAFSGGYPTSGSLTRSALNEQAGARTRLSGVFSGLLILLVLLVLGPVADYTPIAALAGLLLVVAIDLVDVARIRAVLASRFSDLCAFVATVLGTWMLPLDQAIYLGVGISVVLFLRRARLLISSEFVVDARSRVQAVEVCSSEPQCHAIRALQLEGHLFFGAAGELQSILDAVIADDRARVIVVRLKRTQNMDYTAAMVLLAAYRRLREHDRYLLIVGLREDAMDLMRRTGILAEIGPSTLFPTGPRWFEAFDSAIRRAVELVGDHDCEPTCPFASYLANRSSSDASDPSD